MHRPSFSSLRPEWRARLRRGLDGWQAAVTRAAGQAADAAPAPLELGPLGQELSAAILGQKKAVSEAFAGALALVPRWKDSLERGRASWDEFLQVEFFAFADYLAEYFASGDPAYKKLLLGEKLKSLYDAEADDEAREAQTRAVDAAEREALAAVLRPRCSQAAFDLFSAELASVHALLEARTSKTQRVLLVGDCLFLDVVPFVVADLLAAGIKMLPDYATSKNPLELGDQLRKLSTKKFDLIFFSPFSYDFVPEYSQLSEWRQALRGGDAVRAAVEALWKDTRSTLDLVADLFDAPIHVHNSAAIVRDANDAKRLVKQRLTASVRGVARRHVSGLLDAYVRQKNGEGLKHLFVLDEAGLAQRFGEHRAGAFYYSSAMQHPSVFGTVLAPRYVDLIFVNAHLAKKKLVVCDLDNTLWKGVIGEGAVEQHHDRQSILKGLKAKGVVLAINSKNDPARVHWTGATLSEADFVSSAISWEPKVQGMKRIQSDLNLKMKDFVFIDDRPDELELMRMTYPEVLCLDATDERTWRRFEMWRDALEDDVEMDRTEMYRQREQRKAFVKEDVVSDEERVKLLRSLGLKLTITRAQPGDLKRVAELINRTNQFNLEGSRTTFREVQAWQQSPNHVVLLGQTADRFGEMGTTCVAVARIDGEQMQLLPFVLSCRVFGYSIERGVMNHLKTLAARAGVRRIVGRYVQTPQNAPCKDFLADNGFAPAAEGWVCMIDAASSTPPEAEWLQVAVA
ncbi:MAG: family phosphatase [Myxococcales bacterium]|nr:family phosphatase [Myxococcales bacterium]